MNGPWFNQMRLRGRIRHIPSVASFLLCHKDIHPSILSSTFIGAISSRILRSYLRMGHRHSTSQRSRHGQVGSSENPLVARDLANRSSSTSHHGSDLWTPPPYSEVLPAGTKFPAMNHLSANNGISADSPYAFLKEFDTIFVVDDSSSMTGWRWQEAEQAISAIAPVCTQFDPDGIDIYFLNHRNARDRSHGGAYLNVKTAEGVRNIFHSVAPCGPTPYGKRLLQILQPYLVRVEKMAAATDDVGALRDPALAVRPLNIIAITDGEFTDDAESVIVDAAKRLDRCRAVPWQVGIQFFQIGNDEAARRYLEELDDELEHKVQNENIRDIVDTVPWRGDRGQSLSGEGILKVVIGAVHKKYDKRKATH
ncbi:hypothetical protein DTO169E5_1130 [Paecilomyces variotii]|nr:hypothetical protein DTO169E5_1130 [Paecilomyces variotii]